jgi:hypothetical protein
MTSAFFCDKLSFCSFNVFVKGVLKELKFLTAVLKASQVSFVNLMELFLLPKKQF